MPASNYLENKLIDHIFRGLTYTPPTTVYAALFTSDPLDDNSGDEVTGGGYARVAVACSTSTWKSTNGLTSGASSGTLGTTSNAGAITFPTPTGAWGTVTHLGIFDAPSGGNLLAYGALTSQKIVGGGDPAPSFQAGTVEVEVA